MELRNVVSFLRVVELKNFTKAAQELGYAQSTVTFQFQQLERELGAPLLDRVGKTVSLTPLGEQFLGYATQLVQLNEQIQNLGRPASQIRGTLRVGILESLFTWIFARQFPAYHERFPLVQVETKIASGEELLEMLRRNELDIVFLLDWDLAGHRCTQALTHPEPIVFVCRPDHPLAGRWGLSLSEVLAQPLILTERKSVYRRALAEVAAQQGLPLRPTLEVNHTNIIVELVQRGLGISLLPAYTVRRQLSVGELCQLEVSDFSLTLWSQIFYHRNKWVTPQMTGFIQVIQEFFQETT